MNTSRVVIKRANIPDECFGTVGYWEEYWEKLNLIATQFLNKKYYEKFELARERGHLRYARVILLSVIDFLVEDSRINLQIARKIYELLAFGTDEVVFLRQFEYWIGMYVPVDLQ